MSFGLTYNLAKRMGEVEDGMVPIYIMFVIIFWPMKLYDLLKN